MTFVPLRKILVTLITILTILLLLGPQASAQNAAYSNDVRITVYAIEASNGVPGVDPEIRDIVEKLEDTFRYSTYKLVSKIPKKIEIGREEKISLPGEREMRVLARGIEKNRIKLNVKIVEKRDRSREVLNTDFGIVDGGTMIIGGYNYGQGKLMLAISADM